MNSSSQADDATELRLAIIRFKRDKGIKSNNDLCGRANLDCGRYSLPRFLGGDTDDFEDSAKLRSYLAEQGYWPYKASKLLTYGLFADFVNYASSDKARSVLARVAGRYESFQWSSTLEGLVTVSEFYIDGSDLASSTFCTVKEVQHGRASSKTELFEGVCAYSYRELVFLLREATHNRVKYVICDEFASDRITGMVLKTGSSKSIHLTPIFLRRVEDNEAIQPKITYLSECSDEVVNYLKEPLTPFRLTKKARDERIRRQICQIMDDLIEKEE